jgi:hypothetical protein
MPLFLFAPQNSLALFTLPFFCAPRRILVMAGLVSCPVPEVKALKNPVHPMELPGSVRAEVGIEGTGGDFRFPASAAFKSLMRNPF